jgi:serine/threonine protein kinase
VQAPNRAGHILGNYRLMSLLGKGGYAEVYLAENIHLGVQAAIKVLKLRDLDSLERDKFRDEARFMTTLEHPHIIRVLDYGIEMSQRGSGNDGSTPYLVMEYAPIGTLRHLYPHGTSMPLAKIVSYTKQIAEALQYAHDKNIIHRDVKPENMLVRKPDDVALSDFGIAVAGLNTGNLHIQEEEILKKIARGEPILVPGTAAYLAPERLLGKTQRTSDQYSLAVVVYEWLCGSRPFQGGDLEICQKHSSEAPPSLSQRFPYIPQEVERVIMKALSKQPADRYPSTQAFALALENAVQATTPKVIPSIVPPPSYTLRVPAPPTPPPLSVPPTSPIGQTPVNNIGTPSVSTPHTPPWNPPVPPNPAPVLGIPWYAQPGSTIPDAGPTLNDANPYGTVGATAKPKSTMEELSELINEPLTKTREIFVSDEYFVRTKRTRQFRLLGTPLNILSALIVLISGPFPSSLFAAIIGGVISVAMLWRCTISVKKPIAITFGFGIALWWGYVAASVVAHLKDGSLEALSFLIAFLISLGIHIGYVNNRLKN